MSEYQYYEFMSVDRPLTKAELTALHALSTRADITRTSFTNEYEWGEFKGNPNDLMKRFFDLHIYVANWMTAVFMVRLPIDVIPKDIAEAVMTDGVLDLERAKTHWVITWRLDDSEDYDRFAIEDGRSWMARLASVRDELLRGDIRSLYIGWLAGVSKEMVDDDELEPLIVEGLGNLTASQQALAEFLKVDGDLLVGAGINNLPMLTEEPFHAKIDDFLRELPREEAFMLLKQLLEGQGQKAERMLKDHFLVWRRGLGGDKKQVLRRRRTVGELEANAESIRQKRFEREKREREQLEIKRQEKRKTYLAVLAHDFPKAWKVVQQQVARGTGQAYDEACHSLVDIAEAYILYASAETFNQELKQFMANHLKRKALIKRLAEAKIWYEE
jgi:hypothetical protein